MAAMIGLSPADTARACGLLERIYDNRNRVYRKGVRIPRTFPKEEL